MIEDDQDDGARRHSAGAIRCGKSAGPREQDAVAEFLGRVRPADAKCDPVRRATCALEVVVEGQSFSSGRRRQDRRLSDKIRKPMPAETTFAGAPFGVSFL